MSGPAQNSELITQNSHLECVHPERFTNTIDGLVYLPCGIHMAHSGYIMCADDIRACRGAVEQKSLKNVRSAKILRQSVIFCTGTIKRIESVNRRLLQLLGLNISRCLFQSLSPVNVRIIQQRRASGDTPGHLIKIRDVIRKSGKA